MWPRGVKTLLRWESDALAQTDNLFKSHQELCKLGSLIQPLCAIPFLRKSATCLGDLHAFLWVEIKVTNAFKQTRYQSMVKRSERFMRTCLGKTRNEKGRRRKELSTCFALASHLPSTGSVSVSYPGRN